VRRQQLVAKQLLAAVRVEPAAVGEETLVVGVTGDLGLEARESFGTTLA